MAAIYAELHVAGHVYPLLHCHYGFTQATGARGRPIEKVRHGRIELEMDVPRDQFLERWAAAVHQPLPGRVTFFSAKGGAALETVSWEAGHCTHYGEAFDDGTGHGGAGAYVALVAIAAPKLVLSAGGPPGAFVAPAPREHGSPQLGFTGAPLLGPTAGEVATALAPELLPLAPLLIPVAAVVALTLALILATTTPAHAPGLPADPRLLRLRELTAKHAAGTLTANEEAELIDLLAKVKGVHIQKLDDLHVQAPLKGNTVSLPGFHTISLTYTKRTDAARKALRDKFDSSVRKNFIKHLGNDPQMKARLKQSGLTDDEIDDMADGIRPDKYQVHHKQPLDDGGDNSFDNLLLLKQDPYHKSITNLQIELTRGMKPGDTRTVNWPTYSGSVYP